MFSNGWRRNTPRVYTPGRSADELLTALAARHDVGRFPDRTLLFLDEIHEGPEAVEWLRFLREDHPELYVVAAGRGRHLSDSRKFVV